MCACKFVSAQLLIKYYVSSTLITATSSIDCNLWSELHSSNWSHHRSKRKRVRKNETEGMKEQKKDSLMSVMWPHTPTHRLRALALQCLEFFSTDEPKLGFHRHSSHTLYYHRWLFRTLGSVELRRHSAELPGFCGQADPPGAGFPQVDTPESIQ